MTRSNSTQSILQALTESSRAFLDTSDFKQSTQIVYECCKKMLGSTSGYVALLSADKSRNEVLFIDLGGMPCSLDPDLPMPIRGLRAKSYSSGQPVYENNFQQSEWLQYLPDGHGTLYNVLFAPLVVDDNTVGIFGFANKPGGFSEDDALVAKAFAELSAIALVKNKTTERFEITAKRLSALMENAHDAIVTIDERGDIFFWNKAAEKLFGYSTEEIIGKSCMTIIPEKYRKAHGESFEKAVKTGISELAGHVLTVEGLRKNNEIFSGELSLSKWQADGSVFFTGILRDISLRKKMEEEIRGAEDRLRKVFSHMKGGGAIYKAVDDGEDFIIIDFHRPEIQQPHKKNEDLRGKRFLDVFPASKKYGLFDVFKRVWKTGKPELHPIKIYDGEEIKGWRENYVYKLPTGELVALYEDFTERKKMEMELHDSEILFRTIFETSPDPININRLSDGKFIKVNQEFLDLTGFKKNEVLGKTALEINIWKNLNKRKQFFARIYEKGKVENFEAEFKHKDGSLIYAQVSGTVISYKKEPHLLVASKDVTELKKAELNLLKAHSQLKKKFVARSAELKETQFKYSSLIEAMLTGVYLFIDEKIIFANKQCETFFGYTNEELLKMSPYDLIYSEDREYVRSIFTSSIKNVMNPGENDDLDYEFRGINKQGRVIYLQGKNTVVDHHGQQAILGNVTNISKRKLAERKLQEKEKQYRDLVDNSLVGVFSSRYSTGEFVFVNDAIARIYDFDSPEQMIAEKAVTNWKDTRKREQMLAEITKYGSLTSWSAEIMTRKGNQVHVLFSAKLEDDIISGMVMDITKRVEFETALQVSEINLKKAQEVGHIGSWHLDLLDNNLVWSDENYKIFGISKETPLTYEKFLKMVHPEDRDYVDEKWHAAIEGEPYDIEHRLLIDNEVKWVKEKAELFRDHNGKPISGVGITQDITERRMAENEKQKITEELRFLSNQLLTAEERERKRIAGDIHDSIGQALSAIKFSVENSLSAINEKTFSSAVQTLQNIIPLTQQTIEEVRRIIMDLRPSTLDDLGLIATISWICREFESIYTHVKINKEIHLEEADIPLSLKTVIYRILQEAMNNAAQHSNTETIHLHLMKNVDTLELIFEDSGSGFEFDKVKSRNANQKGMGLASMKERAQMSGGTMEIQSSPGIGTRIHVSWPLEASGVDRGNLLRN